jgi:hypothetical protein
MEWTIDPRWLLPMVTVIGALVYLYTCYRQSLITGNIFTFPVQVMQGLWAIVTAFACTSASFLLR